MDDEREAERGDGSDERAPVAAPTTALSPADDRPGAARPGGVPAAEQAAENERAALENGEESPT